MDPVTLGMAKADAGRQVVARLAHIDVDLYKRDSDIDDTASFTRAIAAAKAGGIKRILARGAAYTISSAVDFGGCNGVTFEGAGMGVTVITASGTSATINGVFVATTATTRLTFRKFTMQGFVVDDVTGPRRARTYTGGNGFNTAIQMRGSQTPGGTFPVLTDIRVDQVEVNQARGLPIWLSGVKGIASIKNSSFYLTMDVGWTWCDQAICIGNTSRKSADNGFSLSRGNLSVTCTGNTVDMAANFGVWVSGFYVTGAATDRGPKNFTVSGNTITNVGWGGIHLDDAPQYGSVTGNTVNTVLLGASDQLSDIWGCGIFVGGFPSNNRTAPTDFAYAINISGNTLVNCARGGMSIQGAQHISIRDNLILNPGSAFRADGTTAVLAGDTDFNFGIAAMLGAQGTVTGMSVRGNTVIDDRATPLGGNPIYTSGTTGPSGGDLQGNRTSGFRNQANVISDNVQTDQHTGIHLWTASQKFTGGAVTGSNGGTGTILSYDTNGAATSVRPIRWLTAGLERWHLRANGTAESGSNAGTDLEVVSRTDAGAALFTCLQWIRSTGMTVFKRGTAQSRVVTPVAANGAVALDASAADIHSVSLAANVTATTVTGGAVGQRLTIEYIQDGTGTRTYVWPTACRFAGGAAPAASTTAGWRDRVMFEYDGANWYEISRSVAAR